MSRGVRFFTLAVGIAAFVAVASAAPRQLPDKGVSNSMRAAAEGRDLPPGFRQLSSHQPIIEQALGLTPAAPQAYKAPSEYGVVFQYDGSRSALEAAGIRVQTQIGTSFTAQARPDEIANLFYVSGIRNVRLAHYLQPLLNLALPDAKGDLEHGTPVGSPPVYPGHTGKGIVIGDVDTGIDFNSADFKDPVTGKTRILWIWDQTDAIGPNPSTPVYGYGSEYSNATIDATPGSVRQTDVDAGGHGTNVASCFAGNGATTGCSQPAYRYVGMAPEANIIEVKSDLADSHIIDGVNYIFQKAAALGRPCVVNLSIGGHLDPHDGSDFLGQSLSALTGPGKVICASAGNEGAAQGEKMHGKLTTTSYTSNTDSMTFTIPTYTAAAGAFTDLVLMSGWYDPSVTASIRVKGPNAGDTLSCGFNASKDVLLTAASSKGGKLAIYNQTPALGYGGTATYQQFEIEIYDSVAANAPRNGTWKIFFNTNTGKPLSKRVDLWIWYSSLGSGGSLASTAIGFDSTMVVASPSSADSIISVAAYSTKKTWHSCIQNSNFSYSGATLNSLASFSSWGPRRDGVQKPEIAASGYGVGMTHSSFLAVGAGSDQEDGVHTIGAGTSFAAPLMSGSAALYMQCHPNATPSMVRAAFLPHTKHDNTGPVPNKYWGWGKLDVYDAMDHTPPTCTVTAANGGEIWYVGTSQAITWTAADSCGVDSVFIEYSLDNGTTWIPVADAPNTGVYNWLVPNPPSLTARVRVTAIDCCGNRTPDISDNTFIIAGPTTAVVIASITGQAAHGSVELSWSAFVDAGATFQVLRSTMPDRGYAPLGQSVQSGAQHNYTYLDRQVTPSTDYYYRVAYTQKSGSGYSSTYHLRTPAASFALHAAVPNPTSGMTRIDYEIAAAGNASLEIYNLSGQRVRTLYSGPVQAGAASVFWNGRSQQGDAMPAGAYFARLTSGTQARTLRIMLLK